MDIKRNQVFMAGIIVLFLGIQLRMVQTYVLNEQTTQVLAKHMRQSEVASTNIFPALYSAVAPPPRKSLTPPKWLGWALLSTGAVLVLHSLAMPKSGD
ncbi:MAG: hypothetical protein R3C99_15480 [Pirellulaceae bacterium]|nr:hypothetical protein [Planctomycetales bacterium]MCA9205711.1 hypothetical protein [Planctomycetales bacterium]MCA9211102.1 hypothetical protein [Planctomycetales bacterium]MCA9223907.1 hypothetical protein [Planctomycetales bacterium]MCA9227623.1 hypothetical protein [Planctomycetales bacterium]